MINLGDEVRDEVTGFQGVALARMECLYEATSIRVHPRALTETDAAPRPWQWIEEDRLTIVREQVVVGFRNVVGRGVEV